MESLARYFSGVSGAAEFSDFPEIHYVNDGTGVTGISEVVAI